MHIYYFFFNDTATTEIYTLSYTTLFRSVVPGGDRGAEPELAAVERMLAQERAEQRGFSRPVASDDSHRSEEHTSELQSPCNLVCRLLLEKKKTHASTLRVLIVYVNSSTS